MAPKKRRGRPQRTPEPGERVGIGFKVTPALKAAIEAACAKSGRSQSQEIELRLERSFGFEGLRLVRGEEAARVVPYGRKLLVLLGTDSPDIPIELDIGADDLKDLLAFFQMGKTK